MKKKHDPAHKAEEKLPPETDAAATTESPVTDDITADLEKFRDLAMRTAADFDNFRKRAAREKEEAVRYANSALLESFLPILDNYDLGIESARSTPGAESILEGMSMVGRQFRDFLASAGVEEIVTDGAVFDPNFMEAVGHEPDPKVPEDHVIRQTRRGYKLRDRLLRAASVIVSKGPDKAS